MNRFMKLFKNKEVNNASWIIGGRVAQMVLSFVISIFTTRYLGPSNFGSLNYVVAYVTFFTSLCSLGIGSVIIKIFADDPKGEGETVGTALVLRVLSGFLSAIMIVGIVSLLDRDDPQIVVIAVLSSISLIFQAFDTFNRWFQSKYKSKISTIAGFIAYLFVAVYKMYLLMTGKSVVWFAFATSLDYICIAIVLWIGYKRNSGPKLRFSITKAKYILSQSYHYILSGMMTAIYSQTDKFMLKQMMSKELVGYYSLATSISTTWVFVLAAIIESMYPTIIQYHKTDRWAFERKNKQLYAIVIYTAAFAGLFFTLFSEPIITLVYGEAYRPAVMPLRIVTWYVIFSYLSLARNAWIVCEEKQKYLKYMYGAAAVINVAMNYMFIPLWGASGAALASLLTHILTTIILPLFIKDLRPNTRLMIDAFLLRGVFR